MQLLHPGAESKEIARMVEEHPAFQHPDAANKPNPVIAEKQFGQGLHFYSAKRYPEAEAQFKQAIDYFNQDARYYYYLGLSQLAQKSKLKRDQAIYSFEKGAQLEALSRPSVSDINASLERIQGNLRQFLNYFRDRGAVPATP
jgi:TolA-binding protein